MAIKQPSFGVVIALYNKVDYLSRCLESILNQNYENYTIYIIDASSTDGSYNIACNYSKKNSRVKVFRQVNFGYGFSKNFGSSLVEENYLAFIDADDEWKPGFLKEISSLIIEYPGAKAYTTAHECVLSEFESEPIIYPSAQSRGYINSYVGARIEGWGPHTSSTVFEKTSFKESGGFPTTFYSLTSKKTWLIKGDGSILESFDWIEEAERSQSFNGEYFKLDQTMQSEKGLRIELPGSPAEDQYIFDYYELHHKYAFSKTCLSLYYKNIPNQTIIRIIDRKYGRFFPHLLQLRNSMKAIRRTNKGLYKNYLTYYKYLSAGLFIEINEVQGKHKDLIAQKYEIYDLWGFGSPFLSRINLFFWRARRKFRYLLKFLTS